MTTSGKLVEYLDNGKFICALIIESQPKRVHLINQNGREVKLAQSRLIHCSRTSRPADIGREAIIRELREAHERRSSLMAEIDLPELWELVKDEPTSNFSPEFLAELNFGDAVNDHMVAALLRCVLADKLFFKYREGSVKVHSEAQVEQLTIQLAREQEKARLIEAGVNLVSRIYSGDQITVSEDNSRILETIRDYYLFGSEFSESATAKKILAEAGRRGPHDPYHLLVKAGVWDENENIALLRNKIPTTFSLAARQQAERLLQSDAKNLLDDPGRADYTHLKPMTIDGANTQDFDDALTIEKEDGNYLVGIHISDVAHYVRPGDPLFQEAMSRGTSIYLPEGQIPMLPRHLSQGICSLIQGEIRAAFSFMILLSPEAEVLRTRIKPSVIRVARRLTYEEADTMLESDEEIKILGLLKQKLRRRRLDNGALLLPFPDVNIFVDNYGKVSVSLGRSDTPARTIVSEMMILANTEAARYVSDRMAPGLFRTQGEIKNRIVHGEDNDLFQNLKQRKHLPRAELLTTASPHGGLGVNQYTTITSPIRRLLDLVMQHQLNTLVRRQDMMFTQEMCKDFKSVITRVLAAANNVKQQRHRYWLLKYLLDRKDQYLEALVIESGAKRVSMVLTDTLMEVGLAAPGGSKPTAGSTVKVKVVHVDPLDNTIKFSW